jgi:2-methylcitrate dehydratase PrpD
MQFLADGSWNKPFHTGYAAMSGLIAATLAQQGFTGAKNALEGERGGFLNAYAPHPNPTEVISELGQRFETMEIGVKPYPSCRYGHAAIDALIGLRTAHQLNYQEIESVQIGLPKTGWNIVGDPESDKQNPTNYVEGQFSMPFVAAVALRDGQMTWDDYARHLKDSDTLALCRKIRTVVDDRAEAEFPANMSGVVKVVTTSGTFEDMVVTPKGEPANFLSAGEMRAKFDALVGPYLDDTSCGALADAILSIEDAKDIQEILTMTRPSSQEPLRAVHQGA